MNRVTLLISDFDFYDLDVECQEDIYNALGKYITISDYFLLNNDSIEIKGFTRDEIVDANDFTNLIETAICDLSRECNVKCAVEYMHYKTFTFTKQDCRDYMKDMAA